MEALADLRMEVIAEATEEGLDLWRAEVRDGFGNLVACSKWTTSPPRATRTGAELLAQARSDLAFREARYEARQMFSAA